MSDVVHVVTVAATAPLTVRESLDATPMPAKVVGGVSYGPAVGDRVLAVYVAGLSYYILGAA